MHARCSLACRILAFVLLLPMLALVIGCQDDSSNAQPLEKQFYPPGSLSGRQNATTAPAATSASISAAQ